MHSNSWLNKENLSRILHAVMLPRLSSRLFQKNQIQPMLLLSLHSWTKSLQLMLLLLFQSAFHLWKATLAYAKESQKKPIKPNAATMLAYITDAIINGGRLFDPVCAAATEAYFDAYIANKSEAAAVAYIETLDKNPNFDLQSSRTKT
jgi:hypothetical protein